MTDFYRKFWPEQRKSCLKTPKVNIFDLKSKQIALITILSIIIKN